VPQDFVEHEVCPQQHIVVPEAKHLVSVGIHSRGASFVVVLLFKVLAAVQFYYEASFNACEVGDVASDRKLTPEFAAIKLAAFEVSPKRRLRIRCACAQAACVSPDGFHACFVSKVEG